MKTVKKKSPTKAKNAKADPRHSNYKLTNVRMNDLTRAVVTRKAELYAKGNVSAWLRHAGEHYVPKEGEKIRLKIE